MHAWTWVLQRISAVILIIAVGLHIGFLHFSNAGEALNYGEIVARLKTPVLIVFDILLLIFGLYHALYGLYSVFLDFDSGKKERVVVLGLLVCVGLGIVGFGIFGLLCTARSL
ncbi:MAG: succinate dehydrogenase / fumarate reductase, rane anchor subunit [Thermodesulfobacteriota bacterium]|nr:succinate dehydrogenase / fumarate reductase, rane anchor subunit [Thermodesulfobacteriota bacterium]